MKLQRPQAFAGFLIVSLLALVGFAAFSATGIGGAPPVHIPEETSARIAGVVLGIDLGPDAEASTSAEEPEVGTSAANPDAGPEPAPQTEATSAPQPAPDAAPVATSPPTSAAPPTTAAPVTSPPTTTATPTTTASPYPPGVVGGTRDVEEWRPLVELYFPQERVTEALSVMECESQGNPLAQQPTTLATGLFQFIPTTWAWASGPAGFEGHSAFEPEANVAAAAWLVAATISSEHPRGPWAHWSCQPAG